MRACYADARKPAMSLISQAALLLDEVARTGSIRKAADRLNVSPSALNRRILNLEDEYGVKLYERLPRGVRLTAAGEILLTDIRRWRTEQQRSKARLQELQGLRRGHVAVGLMECLAGDFAETFFRDVQERYSLLTLELFVGGTQEVVRRLVADELHVAVCFNVPTRQDVRKLLSFEVPAGIVVGPRHPLAACEAVRLSDCAGYPFVAPDFSLATRERIERAMQAAQMRTVPGVVSNSIAVIKRLVRDNVHVAFLGAVDVVEELRDRTLRFIPLSDRQWPKEELSLIARNGAGMPPATHAIVERLREQLAKVVAIA